MDFHGVKSTAHPPIIGALGHSTDFIVKQPNTAVINIYCPQSFSGGGLYLNGSWLLWSVYDGLLWYMGHTSMSQFWVQWTTVF